MNDTALRRAGHPGRRLELGGTRVHRTQPYVWAGLTRGWGGFIDGASESGMREARRIIEERAA
jgi:monoamine oxidase